MANIEEHREDGHDTGIYKHLRTQKNQRESKSNSISTNIIREARDQAGQMLPLWFIAVAVSSIDRAGLESHAPQMREKNGMPI